MALRASISSLVGRNDSLFHIEGLRPRPIYFRSNRRSKQHNRPRHNRPSTVPDAMNAMKTTMKTTTTKTTGVRTNRVARTTRQNTRMMAAKVGDKMTSFSLPSTKGGKTKVPAKNGSVVFFFNKVCSEGQEQNGLLSFRSHKLLSSLLFTSTSDQKRKDKRRC